MLVRKETYTREPRDVDSSREEGARTLLRVSMCSAGNSYLRTVHHSLLIIVTDEGDFVHAFALHRLAHLWR